MSKEKKKGRKGHESNEHESDWALLFVAMQTVLTSVLRVQDVLCHRKPYLKVSGGEGRCLVRQRWGWGWGGCVVVSQTADRPPQHVTSDASPPLSVSAPWSNLFACLCQRRLRSLCSARSELIDLSSAGSNNISFCRPPQPCFELRNLPSLSSSLKMCHSCTAGCPRSYDRASKGCFGCVVWG